MKRLCAALSIMTLSGLMIAGPTAAATYNNVTTGYHDYAVNNTVDTWNNSTIEVTNNQYVADNAGSDGTLALDGSSMAIGNEWRLASDGAGSTATVTQVDSRVDGIEFYAGRGTGGAASMDMLRSTNIITTAFHAYAEDSFDMVMSNSYLAAENYLAELRLGNATLRMVDSAIRWARDQGGDARTYRSSFVGFDTGPATLHVLDGSSFIVENNNNAGDRFSFAYDQNATAYVEDSAFGWRKMLVGELAGATGRIEAVRSRVAAIGTARWEYIGDGGAGLITMVNSTGVFQEVSFGRQATGEGTLTAGRSSIAALDTYIGYAGSGQVTLTNNSSLTLGAANDLYVGYTNGASGTLTLGHSTATVHNAYVAFDGGSTGTVHLLPGGEVNAGNDFVMSTNGTPALKLTLAGTADDEHGTILVGGHAQLAGDLVVLLDGYSRNVGDTWIMMSGASDRTGAFDSVTPGYTVDYLADGFKLRVIPEPGALSLLAAAGLLLFLRRMLTSVG